MKNFARTVLFGLIGMVVAGIVTAGAIAATASSLSAETYTRAQAGDRTASVQAFVETQRLVGTVQVTFFPVTFLVVYGLQMWWKRRHPATAAIQTHGCLVRVLASVAGAFMLGSVLYGLYTLVVILPGFPGTTATTSQLSDWVQTIDTRATIVGLGWFVSLGFLYWRFSRDS